MMDWMETLAKLSRHYEIMPSDILEMTFGQVTMMLDAIEDTDEH